MSQGFSIFGLNIFSQLTLLQKLPILYIRCPKLSNMMGFDSGKILGRNVTHLTSARQLRELS